MNFHSTAITRNINRFRREQAFDRSFYTVICRAKDGDVYAAERVLRNPGAELDALIEDIAQGQIENVQSVLEFNPVESWARDCSADIAQRVFDQYGITDACWEFLQDQIPELMRVA